MMGDYPTCKEIARFSLCYFKSNFRHKLVWDLMSCCVRSQSTRPCELHKHPGFKNFLKTCRFLLTRWSEGCAFRPFQELRLPSWGQWAKRRAFGGGPEGSEKQTLFPTQNHPIVHITTVHITGGIIHTYTQQQFVWVLWCVFNDLFPLTICYCYQCHSHDPFFLYSL